MKVIVLSRALKRFIGLRGPRYQPHDLLLMRIGACCVFWMFGSAYGIYYSTKKKENIKTPNPLPLGPLTAMALDQGDAFFSKLKTVNPGLM